MKDNSLLSVSDLTVEFDNHKIIDHVSFTVGKTKRWPLLARMGRGNRFFFGRFWV